MGPYNETSEDDEEIDDDVLARRVQAAGTMSSYSLYQLSEAT